MQFEAKRLSNLARGLMDRLIAGMGGKGTCARGPAETVTRVHCKVVSVRVGANVSLSIRPFSWPFKSIHTLYLMRLGLHTALLRQVSILW